jgi:hypothetical protein
MPFVRGRPTVIESTIVKD